MNKNKNKNKSSTIIKTVKRVVPRVRKNQLKKKKNTVVTKNAFRLRTENRGLEPPTNCDLITNSKRAATCYLDPFYAYANNIVSSFPFGNDQTPCFRLWYRDIFTITDQAFTGGATAGSAFAIVPWHTNTYTYGSTIGNTGVPSFSATASGFSSTASTSMQGLGVAYQAVRVRCTTNVNAMGGYAIIGNCSYSDANMTLANALNYKTSYLHSNADPGSIMQMTYCGSNRNAVDNIADVVDYSFNDASLSAIDPETRVIYFRSVAPGTASSSFQTYEIEVVTCFACLPYAAGTQLYPVVRDPIDANFVFGEIDLAYARSAQYDVGRCVVRDDGDSGNFVNDISAIWGGIKAIPRAVSTVTNWIGNAWSSLFGESYHQPFMRFMMAVPPEHQEEFLVWIKGLTVDFKTFKTQYLAGTRQARAAKLERMCKKLALSLDYKDDYISVVNNTPKVNVNLFGIR